MIVPVSQIKTVQNSLFSFYFPESNVRSEVKIRVSWLTRNSLGLHLCYSNSHKRILNVDNLTCLTATIPCVIRFTTATRRTPYRMCLMQPQHVGKTHLQLLHVVAPQGKHCIQPQIVVLVLHTLFK